MAWSVPRVHHPLSDPGLWVDLGKDRTLLLPLLLWKLLNSQECCWVGVGRHSLVRETGKWVKLPWAGQCVLLWGGV